MSIPKSALFKALLTLSVVILADTSRGKESSDDNAGRSIGGVSARFEVLNRVLRPPEPLRIRVALTNRSQSAVDFRYIKGAFIEHIRIFDAQHREVSKRADAPFFESAADKVSLRPQEKIVATMSVDLWQLYDLPRGKYDLRFYYDLRLIADEKLAAESMKRYHAKDWTLWDTKWYPFSVRR